MNDKENKQNRKEKEETINLSQLLNISGGKNTKEQFNKPSEKSPSFCKSGMNRQ